MATSEPMMLAPETAPCRSHFLPCIRCGETRANVSIDLGDLDGAEACHCLNCDDRFALTDVEEIIARWKPILAWLAQLPHPEE